MAWKIYFNGQDFGAVDEATYMHLFDQLKVAAQGGDSAEFGTEVAGVKKVGLWTPGTPISFEYFDETASND